MRAIVPRVDGRAAGQQGHGLGRAAVIGQRRQQGVERLGDGAGQVGADPAGAAVGLADQVVALGGKGSERIGPAGGGRVPRHDGVAEGAPSRCALSNAAAVAAAELPLTVQLVSVASGRCVAQAAAVAGPAELPLTVQLVSVVTRCRTCRGCTRPPPFWVAELPLTVQLVSVVARTVVAQAAAVPGGGVAADGAVGQRGRAARSVQAAAVDRRSCR